MYITNEIAREPKEAIVIIINFLITIAAWHLYLCSKTLVSGRHKKEDVTKERTAWELEVIPSIFFHLFSQRSRSAFPAPPPPTDHHCCLRLSCPWFFLTLRTEWSCHLTNQIISSFCLLCSKDIYCSKISKNIYLFKKYLLSTWDQPLV